MARVTVEDCTTILPNCFELVVYATQRTRQISAGSPLGVDRDNDKNPVVALKEIAARYVHPEDLRESVIAGFRRHIEVEPQEEEYADLFNEESNAYFIDQTQDLNKIANQEFESSFKILAPETDKIDEEDEEDLTEDDNQENDLDHDDPENEDKIV